MYDWVRIALEKRNPGTWRGPCHKPAGTPEGGQFTGEKPCVEGGGVEGIEHRIAQEIYRAREAREGRGKREEGVDIFSPEGQEFIRRAKDVSCYIDWALGDWRGLIRDLCLNYRHRERVLKVIKRKGRGTLLMLASRIKDDDERRGFVYEYLRDAFNVMEEVFKERTGMQLVEEIYGLIDVLGVKEHIKGQGVPQSLLELFFRIEEDSNFLMFLDDGPKLFSTLHLFVSHHGGSVKWLSDHGLGTFRKDDARLFALLVDIFSNVFLEEWHVFVYRNYWDDDKLLDNLREAKSRSPLRALLGRVLKDMLKCPVSIYRGPFLDKESFSLLMASPSVMLRRLERMGSGVMARTQEYLRSAVGREVLERKGFLSAKEGHIRVYRGIRTAVSGSSILDSWSGDYLVAHGFYFLPGNVNGGVYAVDVPIDSIYACAGSPDWVSPYSEEEFVVIGRDDYLRKAIDISWHNDVRDYLVSKIKEVEFKGRRFGYTLAGREWEGAFNLLALREGRGISEKFVKHAFCGHNMYLALRKRVPLGRLFYDNEEKRHIFVMHGVPMEGRSLNDIAMDEKAYYAAVDYLRKDFLVDAFLRNWDVLGEGGSNIWVGRQFTWDIWRANCSGVGEYRANGHKKDIGLTGFVTDIWRMRSGELGEIYNDIYGGLSMMQIRDSIKEFTSLVRDSALFAQAIDKEHEELYRERLEFLRDLRRVLDYYEAHEGAMSLEVEEALGRYYTDAEKRYRSYLDFAREWNGFRGEDDLRRFWRGVLGSGR